MASKFAQSGPAAQSRHHLRTVQTTAEGTPFFESMNTALCDKVRHTLCLRSEKHLLTYLLTYLRSCRNAHFAL